MPDYKVAGNGKRDRIPSFADPPYKPTGMLATHSIDIGEPDEGVLKSVRQVDNTWGNSCDGPHENLQHTQQDHDIFPVPAPRV